MSPFGAVNHEHEWKKQPDLCLYERNKAAFWITLLCTPCGQLRGYRLPKKSVPKVLRAEAPKEVTPQVKKREGLRWF